MFVDYLKKRVNVNNFDENRAGDDGLDQRVRHSSAEHRPFGPPHLC